MSRPRLTSGCDFPAALDSGSCMPRAVHPAAGGHTGGGTHVWAGAGGGGHTGGGAHVWAGAGEGVHTGGGTHVWAGAGGGGHTGGGTHVWAGGHMMQLCI
jgi:hypothetical protein